MTSFAKGMKFRSLRDVAVHGIVDYGAPFTFRTGFDAVLPAGEILICDQHPGPRGMWLVPERYEHFEQLFVPERDRQHPDYAWYALGCPFSQIGQDYELIMTSFASGSATAEKDHDGIHSTASIDLLVTGTKFGIYIPRDLTRDLDALPECAEFYPTADRLYRGCLAGVWEGISDTARPWRDPLGPRDSCGCVTYTRLSGTRLPLRFIRGFEIAASTALLRALKQPEHLPANLAQSTDGWRVVA